MNKEEIRTRREVECFPYINRGKFQYQSLSPQQLDELLKWYNEQLDAPDTGVTPAKLEWLN